LLTDYGTLKYHI